MHNEFKMTAHICDVRLSVVTSALQTSHFPCYCLVCIFVLNATKSADILSISFYKNKNTYQVSYENNQLIEKLGTKGASKKTALKIFNYLEPNSYSKES